MWDHSRLGQGLRAGGLVGWLVCGVLGGGGWGIGWDFLPVVVVFGFVCFNIVLRDTAIS